MVIKIIFDTGYELTIDLFDNDLVNRWSRLLAHEISNCSILHDDTYSGFITESVARQKLEEAIKAINNFFKREFIPLPVSTDYDDPTFYNVLHEKFEKLAGSDWSKPTRIMLIAPESIKLAIKHINRYCHRLERRPYVENANMRIEFNTIERELLTAEDYNLFSSDIEPNAVILDYATLGKSLYDCYVDKLPATYQAAKTQRHYCANFILQFKKPQFDYDGFKNWCAEQDIVDIPVAELGQIQIGTIRDQKSFDQIKKTAKILNIILE